MSNLIVFASQKWLHVHVHWRISVKSRSICLIRTWLQLLLETGLTAAQLFDALGLEIDLTDGGVVVAIVTVQRHQRRLRAQQSTTRLYRASALPSALLASNDFEIKYAFEPLYHTVYETTNGRKCIKSYDSVLKRKPQQNHWTTLKSIHSFLNISSEIASVLQYYLRRIFSI